MQFAIRRTMFVVAVVGLIFGWIAWLSSSPDLHFHDAYIRVGTYVFSSESRAFWVILLTVLALVVGLLVGLRTAIVCAAKAISRRVLRKG